MTPSGLTTTPLPEMGESEPPAVVSQRMLTKARRVCAFNATKLIAGCGAVVVWVGAATGLIVEFVDILVVVFCDFVLVAIGLADVVVGVVDVVTDCSFVKIAGVTYF